MKIYLAGKVSKFPKKDWRQELLLDEVLETEKPANYTKENEDYISEWHWRIKRFALKNNHDYVGPFYMPFASGSLDTRHNAVDSYYRAVHEQKLEKGRLKVRDLCFAAVEEADLVFAWIDGEAAYGTCVELGYAASLGCQIYVNTSRVPTLDITEVRSKTIAQSPSEIEEERIFGRYDPDDTLSSSDYWLAKTLSTIEIDEAAVGSDIKSVFAEVLSKAEKVYYPIRRDYLLARVVHDSPIERLLIETMYDTTPQMLDVVINQYPWRSYLLDFAVPEIKLCIELDGHDGHKSKKARSHDNARDRKLLEEGWTTIRYTGSDIYKNPAKECANMIKHINRMFKEAGYS